MRILAAKFIGALVHHPHKIRNGAGNVFRYSVARLVTGGNHHAVEHVFQRHLLTNLQSGCGAVGIKIGQRRFTDRNDAGKIAVFQRQKACHDLGQACRIDPFVRILLINDAAGIEVDQHRGLGIDGKRLLRRRGLIRLIVCCCSKRRQTQQACEHTHGQQQRKNSMLFHVDITNVRNGRAVPSSAQTFGWNTLAQSAVYVLQL